MIAKYMVFEMYRGHNWVRSFNYFNNIVRYQRSRFSYTTKICNSKTIHYISFCIYVLIQQPKGQQQT
jgi:hypothetical protein